MKRKAKIIIHLILIMALCIPCSTYAAEGSLSVYDGNTLKKTFSADELNAIWVAEGRKDYQYSGYNTYANYKTLAQSGQSVATGPTVEGLMKKAGINTADLTGKDLVEIKGADGFGQSFTKDQIFQTRYYYPDGNTGSEAGKVSVPAMIDLSDTKKKGTLRIGQIAPNEQNWPGHVHYMTDGDGGKIVLRRDASVVATADITTSVGTKSTVSPGEEIILNGGSHYMKIYFTTDGTTPTTASDIYNYNTYPGAEKHRTIKAPTTIGSTITIKCFKHGFGYGDSSVQTFRYTVSKGETAPVAGQQDEAEKAKAAKIKKAKKQTIKGFAVKALKKKRARISWKKNKDVTGYKIYRATKKKGKYKLIKTISKNKTVKYTNGKLKKGKKYFYKARPYTRIDGKVYYGKWTKIKAVKAK